MFGEHFYHETIKRAVSVFGTLFNNISVKRIWGVLNLLLTTAIRLGSHPSSQAISKDFVAQEKVELILVAKANKPAPTIKAV